jgi:hypothetical protein
MTTALKGRHAVVVAGLKSSSKNRGSADHTPEIFVAQKSGEHRLIPTAQALSPSICSKIGQQLQEIYGSILYEPLPDQFSELLNGLEYARTRS